MLKGFQSDNAYLRDPLSTDVAYSMNAYIQRFGWAQIYINNQSYGYYLIIEEVDKHYLHSRFGTNDGPLYKCTANLTWIGPEPERYENLLCGTVSKFMKRKNNINLIDNIRLLVMMQKLMKQMIILN